MKGFLSKVFLVSLLLFSTLYFLYFAALAHAASQTNPSTTNATTSLSINSDVPNNLHNWTQTVMIEVMSSLTCQLIGIDPTTPNKQCLGVDQKTGKIGFLPAGNLEKKQIGGAIGGMNNMIAMLYTPPLHTADYFQNLAQNFGISKTAYAQAGGKGFAGLQPLMGLWAGFRDIVYTLLTIVFVVIGLGVMLRLKIDPRTVMSIQNQIPRFIVGLLLVTFSFAIAGFLVDLMWVSNSLIFNTLSKSAPAAAAGAADNLRALDPASIQGKSPLEIANDLGGDSKFGIVGLAAAVAGDSTKIIQKILGIGTDPLQWVPFANVSGVTDLIAISQGIAKGQAPGLGESIMKGLFPVFNPASKNYFNQIIDAISIVAGGYTATKFLYLPDISFPSGADLGFLQNIPISIGVGLVTYEAVNAFLRIGLPFLIVLLIVTIALLVALIRLWFTLLMAYVYILIDVVLAPFWIIAGIMPGSQISFSGWLRDLGANLAAFPAVIFMFGLGRIMMGSFGSAGAGAFVPPFLGGGQEPEMFSSLIGIGIILMTPNVVNMLKAALKAPKMDAAGSIGQAIGVGTQIPSKAIMSGAGIVTAARYDISGQKRDGKNVIGGIMTRLFR